MKARAKNYWFALDETQRTVRKAGAGLLLLALAALPAWFLGRPAWQRWQRDEALAQVRVFSEQRDHRSATLALRRAIELDPANPATWQEAARVLGEIGSPELLTAREQLVRLEPRDASLRRGLVADALRLERLDVAQTALADLADAAGRDAAYYRLMATLAQAMGRADALEEALVRLTVAAPDDAVARFNLAAIRTWHLSPEKQKQGREELAALMADRRVRVRAAVEWLKSAAREEHEGVWRDAVADVSARFVPGWQAAAPATGATAWSRLPEHLKTAAAEDGAEAVAALARWLADLGQPRETLVWLESLPEERVKANAVREIAADVSAELGDLDRLEAYLRAGAWGVWPREALTLALASRLQQVRFNAAAGRATWETALSASENSLNGLRALARLATVWNDLEGLERTLAKTTERFPKAFWAHEALANYHAGRRDLLALWQAYDAWVKHWPGDADREARWLILGAIVGKLPPDAGEKAEALQRRDPKSPAVQIALAAVCWRRGKPEETLKALEGVTSKGTDASSAAFWAGLAQADLGQRELAEPALLQSLRRGLSAEEAKLLQAAAAKVNIRWRSE